MFILQEFDFGFWQDLYLHDDKDFLLEMWSIQREKHPTKRYRIVEVIEVV